MTDYPSEETNDSPSKCSERGLNIIIGVLLVVIIASLAVLWYTERKRRISADQAVREATAQLNTATMQLKVSSLLMQRLVPPAAGHEYSKQTLQVDGRPRTALVLPQDVGERLGFTPGDVVIVSPATSQPATKPGTP